MRSRRVVVLPVMASVVAAAVTAWSLPLVLALKVAVAALMLSRSMVEPAFWSLKDYLRIEVRSQLTFINIAASLIVYCFRRAFVQFFVKRNS